MIGVLLSAFAAASWGAGAVFVRLGLVNMRPTTGTLISLVASLAFLLPLVVVTRLDELAAIPSLAWATLTAMVLSGFLNFGLGRLLNYNGVRLAGVAKASPILAISPLFSVLLAVVFLDEGVSLMLWLGVLAIVVGTVMVVSK